MRWHPLLLVPLVVLAACNHVELAPAPPAPAAPEPPVAVIEGSDSVAVLAMADLDGSSSHDDIVAYHWWLIDAPPTSAAQMSPNGATATVLTDVAGTYTVELVVTDGNGLESEPDRFSFDAIPEHELHIELSWDTEETDLDLHLLNADANNRLFDLSDDCHFRNCIPDSPLFGVDWGATLDLDDRDGVGPENANLDTPEDGAFYKASVHYWMDSGGGPSIARVRIFVSGALAYDAVAAVQADRAWDVARIDWPSGDITPLDTSYDCVTDTVILQSATCAP